MKKILIATIFPIICFNTYADTAVNISNNNIKYIESYAQQQIALAKNNQESYANNVKQVNITSSMMDKESKKYEMVKKQLKYSPPSTIQINSNDNYKITSDYIHSKNFVNESSNQYSLYSNEYRQQLSEQAKEYQAAAGKKQYAMSADEALSYYSNMLKNGKSAIGENRLLIFISYSMPKPVLERLIKQGSQVGAVFVLRGMVDGSMKKTQKTFFTLKQNYGVGAMINPKLFGTFGVDRVPAFVVYNDSGQDLLKKSCNSTPPFAKVSGDVSVRYALDQLKKSNTSGIGQLSSNYLDIMDSNSFYNKK